MNEILAIVKWTADDGSHKWGVRGFGENYNSFYRWLHRIPLKNVYENFPWDSFQFVHKSDEDYMLRNFAEFISEDLD
jgi:hypothetical protein